MNYYLQVLKNYANFNGRARRKEYWMFFLFNLIFSIITISVDMAIFGVNGGFGMLNPIYALATFIPSLAVGVRRLHDVGKSGWSLLIVLIPLIGAIWLLVLLATDSQDGENQYGPNPKQVDTNPLIQPETY